MLIPTQPQLMTEPFIQLGGKKIVEKRPFTLTYGENATDCLAASQTALQLFISFSTSFPEKPCFLLRVSGDNSLSRVSKDWLQNVLGKRIKKQVLFKVLNLQRRTNIERFK